MEAGISSEMISVQVSKRTVSDKKDVVCDCCEKMKIELNEVKLELSSFREILRVLQEEIRKISPSTLRTKEMKSTKTKNLILYQRVKTGLPSHQTDEKNNSTREETSDSYP
jgi:predicted methyltransferase